MHQGLKRKTMPTKSMEYGCELAGIWAGMDNNKRGESWRVGGNGGGYEERVGPLRPTPWLVVEFIFEQFVSDRFHVRSSVPICNGRDSLIAIDNLVTARRPRHAYTTTLGS